MAKSKEQRRAQVRTARKKYAEVKRPVVGPDGQTYLKSFYGDTKEEAIEKWKQFTNPLPDPSPADLTQTDELARHLPKDSVPWWFVAKLWPLKKHQRPNSIASLQQAARHFLPECQDITIDGVKYPYLRIQDMTAPVLAMILERIEAKRTLRNANAKEKRVRQPDGTFAYIKPTRIYKALAPSQINKCRRLALEINELAADELEHASGSRRVPRINGKWVPIRSETKKTLAELDDEVVYTPPMLYALIQGAAGTVAFVPSILCACGLRINEALGVLSRHLKSDAFYVESQEDGNRELAALKSDNSLRRIPLPADMHAMLAPYRFRGERLALGVKGQVLMENNVRRSLYAVMRKVGLPLISPHRLRKAFSTWLENNGCPKSVRRSLLGHSNNDLDGRYNKAHEDLCREWMGKFFMAMLEPLAENALAPTKPKLGPKVPARGERNARTKVTDEIREEILTRLAEGQTQYRIAKEMRLDKNTVRKVRLSVSLPIAS